MNIYFSGIGGVGLGPLAEIALDAGYLVSGSDPKESLMTRQMAERGVQISLDQSGSFLELAHEHQPIDWFVYTSALPADHPELLAAKRLGIKSSKRDELIAHIIQDKDLKLIAVAGTHGKTTTTSLLVWTFKQLGIPVSYSVGTTMSFGPSGQYDPKSQYFIYECDEYDRNFLHFQPHLAIVPSISYDHPDTYPTEDDYKSAFRQFLHQSKASILWQQDADYIATRESTAWCLQGDEQLTLELKGAHNRRNATLVLKALERLETGDTLANRDAVNSFPGVDRRFERLAENLYSDYAVHPREIAATIEMARELNDTVVTVYEPHQNVRQYEIRADYTDCFEQASETYWLPTYLTRERPGLHVLTPAELTQGITNYSSVQFAELNDELWQAITNARDNGALVLCMGAGTIDSWVRERLKN